MSLYLDEHCPLPDDFFNRRLGRTRIWKGRVTGKWYVQLCEADSAGIPRWNLCAERDSHKDAIAYADFYLWGEEWN